ncbi:ImmA/IrrE family metallo-endopeptidase [Amycolatopsis sp. H20-H5]|uniref:ImmA/IrrE family metallo-endopeptidase n=1 Tax=Amycolatopsis sp. H20-H5 TaxID=3046309 RepID=UPI002DB7DB80|nr:ImmA/IrrE family metallo-endopeptidase [Amycolatopsis sp. H20-H5]MEC3978137.1 ImmA/IrrE family metallo-endopeptidase [Amycolatopsis sp. H20-H5]
MIDQTVEQHAWSLLVRHGIDRPPVQVEGIAQAEGIQVIRTASSGNESGFLLRDGQRTVIGLNSKNPGRRQRFTVAHELGHWKLHQGKPLIVDHAIKINKRDDLSSAATDREEIDANAFAAALLMPQSFVHAALNAEVAAGVPTVERLLNSLADQFLVSIEAMRWRLVNLGLIN